MSLTNELVRLEDGSYANRTVLDEHFPDLTFESLLASADPMNWSRILPSFWVRMERLEDDEQGWSRVIEHIRVWGWTLRTPLKFWKTSDGQSYYHIDYELATGVDPSRIDGTVTMDSGYIDVRRIGSGVRAYVVKTEVLALMAGMGTMLSHLLIPWLGFERDYRTFYRNAARLVDPVPFEVSQTPGS